MHQQVPNHLVPSLFDSNRNQSVPESLLFWTYCERKKTEHQSHVRCSFNWLFVCHTHFDQRLIFLFESLHPQFLIAWTSFCLQQWNATQCFPCACINHIFVLKNKNRNEKQTDCFGFQRNREMECELNERIDVVAMIFDDNLESGQFRWQIRTFKRVQKRQRSERSGVGVLSLCFVHMKCQTIWHIWHTPMCACWYAHVLVCLYSV